jgi:hypothetical protein
MIKTLVPCKNPEILVITPLKKGSKVSPETKKTLKRCDVPFHWVSYMGEGNPYKNMVPPWRQYRKEHETPPYIIKIDNDLTCKRGMLDKLYEALVDSPKHIGYSYCCFKYRGKVNIDFDHLDFNIDRLIQSNYISSCSLMKTKTLEETGSFITDDKYFRLLDWALWLQFLRRGYIGQFVPDTSFTAYASPTAVSCGSQEDYRVKHMAIVEDFIRPYLDKFKSVKENLS